MYISFYQFSKIKTQKFGSIIVVLVFLSVVLTILLGYFDQLFYV